MKHLHITTLLVAIVFGMPLLPLLAQGSGTPPPTTPPMSMSGMMENCQKDCDTMSLTTADMSRTIAAASKSNDAAALHAALDQVQAGVAKLEGQMKDCKEMMQHMQHMMPMPGSGGMMTPPAPDARH